MFAAGGVVLAVGIAPAWGATVEVRDPESLGPAVVFTGATGEVNTVDIDLVGTEAEHHRFRVVDAAAPLTAGPGCTGGGGAGSPVECLVRKGGSVPPCDYPLPCDVREADLIFSLGDSADRLDAAALPQANLDFGVEVDSGSGADFVAGSPNADVVDAGTGADVVHGAEGSDALVPGPGEPDGSDFIDGGDGKDTLRFTPSAVGSAVVPINVSLNQQPDDGPAADGDDIRGVEDIATGPGDDVIDATGAPADQSVEIASGAGADTLVGAPRGGGLDGGEGDDALRAGGGVTSLLGQAGNDVVTGGPGDDLLSDFTGNDVVTGLGGSDTFYGGPGNDVMDGGDGFDTVDFGLADDGVTVDLGEKGPQNTRGAGTDALGGFEFLVGSRFADRLTGSNGRDTIVGDVGQDLIRGGGGPDELQGDEGRDTLLGDGGIDILFARAYDRDRDRRLACGPGSDAREDARLDREDREAISC